MKKSAINILEVWKNWQKNKKKGSKKANLIQKETTILITFDGDFISIPKYFNKLKMYNNEIELF